VKISCRDEAREELIVPQGGFASRAELILSGRPSEQVIRHMFDGGEVRGGMIGSDPALVVAEDHGHDPVPPSFRSGIWNVIS
jgi:hypothetical protein